MKFRLQLSPWTTGLGIIIILCICYDVGGMGNTPLTIWWRDNYIKSLCAIYNVGYVCMLCNPRFQFTIYKRMGIAITTNKRVDCSRIPFFRIKVWNAARGGCTTLSINYEFNFVKEWQGFCYIRAQLGRIEEWT